MRYSICPEDKKSVILMRNFNDDRHQVTVEEHYRWARGFSDTKPAKDDKEYICEEYTDCDDLVMVYFDYEGKWTEKQKKEFERAHSNYTIPEVFRETVYLRVLGPYIVKNRGS